ncbi:hypothetical protein [Streptomyces sp. NPDC059378]|uniref:hypothetical protein n=1 Tax=Streptomyces sp. NPDC059378 TaxID=3346815 RepID=UPI0036760338
MGYRIVRRAAVAAASVAVAATGLLAAGGPASAATVTSSKPAAALVSHSAQYTNTLESRGGHRNDGQGRHFAHGRDSWVHRGDESPGRRYDGDGGRADREILRWYNDQISWFRDDDANRYQVRRHEGHSYRWDGRRGLPWTTGDTGFRDVRKHHNEGFAHHR